MSFTTKSKLNNTIEQLNKQFGEFTNEVNSVNSLKIYTDNETKRRTTEIQKKYTEKVKITSDNLKKCLPDWVITDIQTLSTSSDKDKNMQHIFYDFAMLYAGSYSDNNIYTFIQPYLGDLISMRKLSGITALKQAGISYYILSLADSIYTLQNELEENFEYYLELNIRRYSPIANSISNLSFVTYEQTLLNTVEKLEKAFNIIEQSKTKSYNDIKKLINK